MNLNKPGKHIIILGNPHSPHISVWLRALDNLNRPVDKIAINHDNSLPVLEDNFSILFSSHWFRFLPKMVMYLLGGIFLFFRYMFKPNVIVHAHNASGYGVMARLSGKKYILTTYGSEIFGKESKSFIYNLMMGMILRGAFRISSTSWAMEEALVQGYKVDRSKISTFSLGVSNEFLNPAPKGRLDDLLASFLDRYEFVFFSNRRITPHYNIDYILDEFSRFLSLSPYYGDQCGLLLLSGDSDPKTLREVKSHIQSQNLQDNIMVINHFIDKEVMSSILEKVTATISLAKTDQLSAAILEAIAKGVLPIFNKLTAYADIQKNECGIALSSLNPGVLCDCMETIVCKKYDPKVYEKMKTYASLFLDETVINKKITKFFHRFM